MSFSNGMVLAYWLTSSQLVMGTLSRYAHYPEIVVLASSRY
jgi:hypothetical protein